MSEPPTMDLIVAANGSVTCIYDEMLNLRDLGRLTIKRASHVEPDAEGNWLADIGPAGGPLLGPFGTRSEALSAERMWLLTRDGSPQAHSQASRGSDRPAHGRCDSNPFPLGDHQ